MQELFKAGSGDTDGVIRPAVDDRGRAVVIIARIAVDVRAFDEAAEGCNLRVERRDCRVKVGGLGGEVRRVDDFGGNVGCGSLGRFVLRDCGRRGERTFFILRFFGRLFHLEIFVRCCRRRFYGRSLPARRVIGRFGG